ncbi:DUF3558 domain-containing protein [Saccharomonospora piscinae]|nr:DUF3558 domain-containing protein [Saccharomonospora piscinae]
MVSKTGMRSLAAVAALLSLVVSGCAAKKQGYVEPETSPSSSLDETHTSSSNPSSSIGSSIDPCELLSAEDLAEVGDFKPTYKEQGGARACHWQNSVKDGGDGFVFAVSVRDSQSIETVNDEGGGIREDEVNERPSVVTGDPKFDDCAIVMKLDDMSRVDVTVPGDPGSDNSCEVAKVIAGMVEPRLPDIP